MENKIKDGHLESYEDVIGYIIPKQGWYSFGHLPLSRYRLDENKEIKFDEIGEPVGYLEKEPGDASGEMNKEGK